ncbi:MAG: phage tail tape measure protein [Kiritimatiellae bacterium]|nr:phage tail tape measure protein [Kiritimatiellia bacterium]
MAKDIKKKFTITLDIGTGDAEKQLKSTAENIKQTLKSLSDGSNSLQHFNELSDMLVQIDAQMANLKATYGDGFEGLFNKISASVKNDFQSIFDFAHKKLAEFNADIQADKTHLDSLNAMMTEYKKASKVGEQAFNLDKITGFKGTKKEVQELYAVFDQLAEAKKKFESSGDFTSEAYIKNYIQLMKTAAGLINADKLSENEGKDFGIDVDALSNKAEKAKGILKEMFGSASTNPASHLNVWMQLDGSIKASMSSLNSWAEALAEVMSDSIKAALNGDNLVTQNKKSAESYNQLTAKVNEYLGVQKQLQTLEKGSQARKDALKRAGEIQAHIVSMKELDNDQEENVYDIFEGMNSGAVSSADAISKLCGILQIDIPGGFTDAAQSASAGFNTITKGAENASKSIQKVMYHLGNLLNGKGSARDTFGDMPYNLTEAAQGSGKFEKYGYGVLGGGLFGVNDPSTINPDQVVGTKFIQSIDLSKYNMYLADTEERAASLMDFLSKLQKYALKGAEPNYTGFDEQLQGINVDTLYDQFKVVFAESDLTKEKFNGFISEMINLLNKAGLKFDASTNELDFTSLGDLGKSDNISTRFLKMLGYQGVNVGGTSFDGFGQGSVLFDFNQSDIVGYFSKAEQAIADFQNRLNNGSWDGSNEQLQQIAKNIDAIVNSAIAKKEGLTSKSQIAALDQTINKLSDVRINIAKILSGNSSLQQITNDSAQASMTEQIDAAKTKMQEFLSLAKTYTGMEYVSENDVNSGIQKLQEMRTELVALAEQGELTSKDLQAINDAFDIAEVHLTSMDHESHRSGGMFSYTYEYELAAAEKENARLRAALDHSVSNDVYDDLEERAEQLKKENGLLEEKLELLTEISNQYGMSITQKDRDRYEALVDKEMDVGLTEKEEDRQFTLGEKIEEADSAMEELGETYDKIILKLANGKKVEILPDDKGLRALDKIANEYYEGEYNGQEIQDVIFVRQKEQEVIAQTNQQLEEQVQTQQQIEVESKKAADVVKHFNEVVGEITGNGIESSDSANYYDGKLDAIYDQIEALHELGVVSDEVMEEVESNYKEAHEYIDDANRSQNLLNELSSLNNKATLTEDAAELASIVEERKKLIDFAEEQGYFDNDVLETQRAITAEIEKQLQIKKQIAQVEKAYEDVFDVLHNIGTKWKDLDTVDSAIGSMPLSDIDAYIQELERLIKLIKSVDPNFQHGDKDEYDGAVKTLEKMQALSARTKLTDEFKNTINQFEQLGKFQWSDELTNGYLKILNDIRNGTYKTIGQCVAKFNELSAAAAEPPLMDTTTAFKELVNYISKSSSSPSYFFDTMEGSALKANDALKQIFKSLNLIGQDGKVNLSSLKSGFTNLGGFVSDQYTMIARKGHYIGKIQSIQPKLQQAQQEGAQIGAIFDIIEDKAKGIIYEIQNTVPGKSVLGHHSGKTNMDVLNASAAHIDGLVNTLQILAKNGLFVDWGGDNVLYDPQKGFSIIDMGDKGDKHFTVSGKNTIQENLDRMVSEMLKFASVDMRDVIKSTFADKLYASANKIDSSVVNPYAPKQQKAAQVASAQVTAAVKSESDAHDQNTESINAENDALKAQIELKKQAQSMKWEAFATDDSLSALKQSAGFQTLGQLEAFWKKSNYEKNINFHEITEAEAKQIFKDKLSKGLASSWYGSADFSAKSKLENEILADDEIRNAALSYLYHLYKKMPVSQQDPAITDFQKFLNTEFTVYRGDKAPLIYDDQSKLSFSFKKSTAEGFNSQVGTAKIKPKDTIGNAGSGFYSEVETFIDSYETSWYQKNREAFEDFYNQQTKEMQKEIDAGLVNFEKKRVSDIIGDDLSTLTHKALNSSYWKHNVADDLNKGIVPSQITVPTDGSDYAQFADAYNGLSDTMKRFVMFFASMDELSASLPKQFSITTNDAYGFKYGKAAVGDGAKLFNAILNDPEGRSQHIAKLTGEQAFNLMGQTPTDINAEADARERNAKAIRAEAQATQTLKAAQDTYDQVMYDLWDSVFDSDGRKKSDLSKVWSFLHDVQHTDQSIVDQGLYTQKSTGDSVQATDLFQLVVDIEHKYNENLDNIKDYLKQVYAGIDFSNVIPQQASSGTHADFQSTKLQAYETAKNAYKSGNQKKYFKILGMLNHLDDIDVARPADIANAEYEFNDSGRYYNISHLVEMVNRLETVYHENFDYVYDYLKQVYGEATIDNALANISGDGASRPAAPKYTTLDYENVYSAAPVDMQAAIDDLAVFQQRYEQLYALTNTQPIEFMFPGKPTLNEVKEVITVFDEFKAKQREIFQLQLIDYEGNKEKIQELQAEAIGLQNKLLNASLGDDADIAEYKLTYGFTDDQDADRFKKLVDMTESVHTVMNDLTRIGEYKTSLIPQEMQDMLDSDSGDAIERFMAQHAQQAKAAQAAAQQANASADATERQLQAKKAVTAEDQKQAALTDKQDTQTAMDVAQTQDVQAETTALNELLLKINAVEQAVKAKTAAFEAEGVAVEETVNKEISALTQLKTLLDNIQNALQVVFASNNYSLGDINATQDKTSNNTLPNILQGIKSTLEQIYGVLSKSTGVEADNKNSAKVKEPVVDNNVVDSDSYKLLASKIPEDVSTETTLSAIKGSVDQLAKKSSGDEKSGEKNLDQLVASLLVATTELKSVANGIVQQQKASKSDTSVANARIADKDSYAQIRDVALNSLGDKALESEVTEMKALANGVVKVTGWLKVAEDAWEGFTVQINEANEASKLAFSTNSKAAKQAAAQAKKLKESGDDEDDLNIKKYNPKETKALAQEKIAKYTAEGKVATVQFKDSGRYTISTLEKIGGLTKQVFQTFDENDQMIERTTATMSNATLMKLQELQQIAKFGFDNGFVKEDNEIYKSFKQASDALEMMNQAYRQTDQLSNDQINNWNLQIEAVIALGKQVQKLVAQTKNPAINMKANKKAYGATPVVNAQAKFNTLESRAKPYADSGWSDISSAYQQYATALKNLINLQNQFQNGKEPTDAQKAQFVQLKDACSAAHKELKKLVDTADKFNAATEGNTRKDILGDVNVNDRNSRAEALKSYVQEVYGAQAVVGKFNGDMTELQFTIKNTDGTITNMTAAFNSAKTQIGALHGETKKATTIFDELGLKFKELWRYAAARLGVDELIQAVRKGVEYVREIDNALTDLKKVTNETDATYAQFLQTMSKTAGTVGSTVADLTTMAAEWGRLGYSLQEAGMLAESTAILLNVSEFDDATTASEALISTMQAFGYAADESQHVVDILNEVKVTCLLV